ncbi:hypothetical protein AMS68_003444 [Peltaster fructicola]|uniref:NADH:ubiquinone oxidoreductase 20.1kD subunit n=1 Tax=Peltaster fructicola TaxID=286661 RepID=A0A6H0XT38_9PEZI|nr:hypothetical protein AMS68_003444 [Peltaster fructicola]
MSSALRAFQLTRSVQTLSRQAAAARPAASFAQQCRSYASSPTPRVAEPKPVAAAEQASEDISTSQEDPNQNGNYPDPSLTSALPIKRQFRDPYADWWDKQERRNYGEPLHEDNDILGVFSPEEYTHVKPGLGALQILAFIGAFCSVLLAVRAVYPDKPSAPRTFEGGLEAELGGAGALRARTPEEDSY